MVIIGAGIGGLAAALLLSHAGVRVQVFEQHATPGGKMRTTDSTVGPVDAGPTVFTLRPIFEALFASVGARLDACLDLHREVILARHFWPDGTQLDLFADPEQSRAAVAAFAGEPEAIRFETFNEQAGRLFRAFEGPVMQAARPDRAGILLNALAHGHRLLPELLPHATLARRLAAYFTDPRLRQLFGRYATYVGGSPYASPAVLALIWSAEAAGVWSIKGGMHQLARTLERLAKDRGAQFTYEAPVARVEMQDRATAGVVLEDGMRVPADAVLFNGDPAALASGLLGPGPMAHLPAGATQPRSLSACVWTFAAEPRGLDLMHHNVFFGRNPQSEFDDLAAGRMPRDPTLYVCAQDRGEACAPAGRERFEIIMNAPPVSTALPEEKEIERCQKATFRTLQDHGLRFSPQPDASALTRPQDFAAMFPGSDGSLYGRSPHGMMASFRRPTARSPVKGLYLAGGGVHPGPGIPMAALSGRHAAEAILTDLASTSTSRRTATPGGMSTASRTAAPTASRSSGS